MSTATPPGSLEQLPVDRVKESPFNPRQRFDAAELDELVASLRAHGVLQPIKARPVTGGWELVWGHRRLRAAKLAGIARLPAIVAPLTDEQVVEEQAIENHQRSDVHPLEEADQFKLLHERFKQPVVDIAKRIGLSIEYVYARLKLCSLCKSARAAFLAGEISASVAILIARIPREDLQQAALDALKRDPDEPIGSKRAFDLIQARYMLKLATAPFPTADAKLLEGTPGCNTCPKRTGTQPELFSDVKGKDICTDPVCYRAKVDASWKQVAERAKAEGKRVLPEKQSAEIFYPGSTVLAYNAKVVDLDAKCAEDPRHRTYRQLLKKEIGADLPVAVARDQDGHPRELADKKLVAKALADAGVTAPRVADTSASDARKKDRERATAKREGAKAVVAAVLEKVGKYEPGDKLFRLIGFAATVSAQHDTIVAVAKRRELKPAKGGDVDAVRAAIGKLSGADLRGLVVELLISHGAFYSFDTGYGDALEHACSLYDLDPKAIAKAATKAAKPTRSKK